MSVITAALLRRIMPQAGVRADWAAEALEQARVRWVGNDPLEVAHWLAQLAHESAQLRYVRELASGEAYEGRVTLGNTQPGDGRRFRGRGFIQLTGRSNYGEYEAASGHGVLAQPDLLEDVYLAADVSGWFWSARRIWARTEGADDRVLAITKIVNGGTNGIDERRAFFERARLALVGQVAPTPAPAAAPAPIEHHDWPAESPVPSGDVPTYGESKPMEPISIAMALMPLVSKAIPEVAKWFKGDTPVSERNVHLATKILDTVTAATGSVNAMEAAQRINSDPAALEQARAAVIPMLELVEAGGGGIAGARLADAAGQAAGWQWNKSMAFLAMLLMLPLVYMASVSVLFQVGGAWPDPVRASALMMIIGIGLSIGAYVWGSSNKPSVPGK